jgi:hypothetical protein
MGYVAGFDEDVFISYAHNDDDVFAPEQWGWVTRLHQDLEQRVRNHLGSDVRLWRDCEIRNNEDFTKKTRRLRQADCGGNREVGQGDQVRRHQAAVKLPQARVSVTPVRRKCRLRHIASTRGNAVRNHVKNLAPGRLDAGSRAAQKKAPRERG